MAFKRETEEDKLAKIDLLKYKQDSGEIEKLIPNRMQEVVNTLDGNSSSWKAGLLLDKIDQDGIEAWGIPENEWDTHYLLAHISYVTSANGSDSGRPVIHYRPLDLKTLERRNRRAKELDREVDVNSTDIQHGRFTVYHDIIVLHVPEKVKPKSILEYEKSKEKVAKEVTKRKPVARKSIPKTRPKAEDTKTDVEQDNTK